MAGRKGRLWQELRGNTEARTQSSLQTLVHREAGGSPGPRWVQAFQGPARGSDARAKLSDTPKCPGNSWLCREVVASLLGEACQQRLGHFLT